LMQKTSPLPTRIRQKERRKRRMTEKEVNLRQAL
jgi:hypothetical protein